MITEHLQDSIKKMKQKVFKVKSFALLRELLNCTKQKTSLKTLTRLDCGKPGTCLTGSVNSVAGNFTLLVNVV
jgi:hypothetical protein